MASVMQLDGPFQAEVESTSDETLLSLKRKSISLNNNADGNGGGGGDLQVVIAGIPYLVSELTREQRRDMRKRLKTELKEVKVIVDKLAFLEQRAVDKEVSSHPPPLEIPSRFRQPSSLGGSDGNLGTPGTTSKEKRTPKANQMYCNSEYISAKDKMPPPEKLKPKQVGMAKKGGQQMKSDLDMKRQKVELSRQRRMAELMKQCGTLLKKLMTHKHAWVFNEPVDVVKLGLHDYNKVIRKPMDLGTIKKKLEAGVYSSPTEFADDVKLTFSNAMTYNPPGHDVYVMADIIRKMFESRWQGIREKIDEDRTKCKAEDEVLAQQSTPQIRDLKDHLNHIEDQLSSLSKGTKPVVPAVKGKPGKKLMTFEEKRRLSKNLESIPADRSVEIVQIIRKHNPKLCQSEDEIEVDIDMVDNDTLWELHKYVASFKKKSAQKQLDPGVSDFGKVAPGDSPRRKKSVEGAEEDVDIDDDDMPKTNFPPVVIDKDPGNDPGNEGSKSSGDSSSSSSGSSSSESDSGSSSGSDSETEGPRPAGIEKPNSHKDVREQLDSQNDGVKKPVRSGDHADVVDNVDKSHGADSRAGSAEEKQPERQVSPEKSLRAALLKGRFADTILKAREKTFPLNKSDNVDPEKLRKEREELERKQREERARLQAEAKAAEVARRKAEAEAMTEAKKKREVEREAARRALQQMERTVELDAHCEMMSSFNLTSVGMEVVVQQHHQQQQHLHQQHQHQHQQHFHQSSAGEVSPASSPDFGMLQQSVSRNPLEQLGLYMKLEEEEDLDRQGDGEVAFAEGTDDNGEVEEGEID